MIMTAVDAFSKWLEAAPVPNKSAECAAEFMMENVFLRHGFPNEIITDGGAWFRARVETEIGPLLDEYWYDAPERAKEARAKLLAELM